MESNVRLEQLFQNADAEIKAKNFEVAIEKLKEILAIEPHFGKAYNHLGWIEETKFQNYIEAERLYKLALEYAPNYLSVYYNYSIILSTLKKFTELEELLKKAEQIPGINMATIHNEYGIMYEYKGNYEKAMHHYKQYAVNTLKDNQIETARKSLARCKSKMELLKEYE